MPRPGWRPSEPRSHSPGISNCRSVGCPLRAGWFKPIFMWVASHIPVLVQHQHRIFSPYQHLLNCVFSICAQHLDHYLHLSSLFASFLFSYGNADMPQTNIWFWFYMIGLWATQDYDWYIDMYLVKSTSTVVHNISIILGDGVQTHIELTKSEGNSKDFSF